MSADEPIVVWNRINRLVEAMRERVIHVDSQIEDTFMMPDDEAPTTNHQPPRPARGPSQREAQAMTNSTVDRLRNRESVSAEFEILTREGKIEVSRAMLQYLDDDGAIGRLALINHGKRNSRRCLSVSLTVGQAKILVRSLTLLIETAEQERSV